MRFSVASGTDNSLLQLIANDTEPYGIGGLLPIQRSYGFVTLAGVFGSTNRLTYTVPANKIARLDYLGLTLVRITVAATVAGTFIDCGVIPSGGSRTRLAISFIGTNVVGERDNLFVTPKLILESGDTIEINNQDSASGGTVTYNAQMHLSELDA